MLAKTKVIFKNFEIQTDHVGSKIIKYLWKKWQTLGWFWLLWGSVPAKLVFSGTGGKKWEA